jgi:phenylpyruvate tautomerase PptA (4-oxalocrotonate tautomerase family)
MPHPDLRFNSRELTESDINAMAEELCEVLKRHLNICDESVSVALTPVQMKISPACTGNICAEFIQELYADSPIFISSE